MMLDLYANQSKDPRRSTQKRVRKNSCKVYDVPIRVSNLTNLEIFSSDVFFPGFTGFKQMETVSNIKDVYSFKKKLGSGSFGTVF